MNFSNVFSELASCQTQDILKTFLLENKFTFKFYPAKQPSDSVDDNLAEMDNEYVYVIKHPYHNDDEPTEDPPVNDNLALLHQFGRGIVIRANFNTSPVEYKLMGLPLPFGEEDFLTKQNMKDSKVTTLIDGTGFNVCKDPVSGLLFVSTRACGGYYPDGPTNYFGNPDYTYGTMFREALEEHKMVDNILDLETGISLHFVMLHPHDMKVYNVDTPMLHLVNVYKINDTNVEYVDCFKFQSDAQTNFTLPVPLPMNTVESVQDLINHSDPKITPGIKIYNPTTNVWSKRIYSKSYERIKELLGNDTNILFTLIRLRHQEGKYRNSMRGKEIPADHKSVVNEFLEQFPQYSELYTSITQTCKEATGEIFDSYLKVYANRDDDRSTYDKLQDVNLEFRDLVRNVHNLYLAKRTEYQTKIDACVDDEERSKISKPQTKHHDVMTYFNGIPPARIYDRLKQYSHRRKIMSDIFQPKTNDTQHNKSSNSDVKVIVPEVENVVEIDDDMIEVVIE
jgi:hypothetical protein